VALASNSIRTTITQNKPSPIGRHNQGVYGQKRSVCPANDGIDLAFDMSDQLPISRIRDRGSRLPRALFSTAEVATAEKLRHPKETWII
jgi:hypothetical protein